MDASDRPRIPLAQCIRTGHNYRHMEPGNPKSRRRCTKCGTMVQDSDCTCEECVPAESAAAALDLPA